LFLTIKEVRVTQKQSSLYHPTYLYLYSCKNKLLESPLTVHKKSQTRLTNRHSNLTHKMWHLAMKRIHLQWLSCTKHRKLATDWTYTEANSKACNEPFKTGQW